MPAKEKQDGKCNAKVRNIPDDMDVEEAYCMNVAGFRTEHTGEGRCYLHGGAWSKNKEEVGAPAGNINAEKHGIHTERQRYYEKRGPAEQAWIDAVVESLLDDLPGGGDPSFAKLQMIRNIAIDMHKQRNANDYIEEVGVVHRDKTVGYTDDGRPMKEDVENPVNIAYDRLSKTITRQMKELGILDDPDSKKAESNESIANELSKLREARSE